MSSSELYEADILEWSERQVERLRRIAADDRLNTDAPDWPNIIEEIESVGRSELSSVQSLLLQALVHMLKAEAWPLARDTPSWRADAVNFRSQASLRFSPSMRQRIDLGDLYAKALRGLPATVAGQVPLPLAATSSVTLDELLGDE